MSQARDRFYVGYNYPTREVFKSVHTPTIESHGDTYTVVVGPFRTKRAAMFMRDCGENNPNCCTVSQAEKASKEHMRFGRHWVKVDSPDIIRV